MGSGTGSSFSGGSTASSMDPAFFLGVVGGVSWVFVGLVFLAIGIVLLRGRHRSQHACTATTMGVVSDITSRTTHNGVVFSPLFEYEVNGLKYIKQNQLRHRRARRGALQPERPTRALPASRHIRQNARHRPHPRRRRLPDHRCPLGLLLPRHAPVVTPNTGDGSLPNTRDGSPFFCLTQGTALCVSLAFVHQSAKQQRLQG